MFWMDGLVPKEQDLISVEQLLEKITSYFSIAIRQERVKLEILTCNVTSDRYVNMLWYGEWKVDCFIHCSELRVQGFELMQEHVKSKAAKTALANTGYSIAARFYNDPEQRYTSEIMLVLEFLESLPGVIVFDKNKLDLY